MGRIVIVVVVVVLSMLAVGPLLASASSTPDFDVYVPENVVEPGEETVLELEIRNAASVEEDDTGVDETPPSEARDVSVELDPGDEPIEVKTAETPMPTMSAQALFSETFSIAVDENATAGTYEVDVEFDYTYTTTGGAERSTTDTETIEVIVEEEARFDADAVESDLLVGDRGTVELELTNTGVENATDAVVQFDSPDENLQAIDPTVEDSELQTVGSEEYVGDWEINETVTAAAAMELSGDAIARTYPVSVSVQFRDDQGVDRVSRELRVGVSSSHEQTFSLENVSSDLHVGEDGSVTGELVNEGPHPVDGVVLVVDDGGDEIVPDLGDGLGGSSNVYPRETQYAVGSLKPGETTPFEYRLGIGGEGEPGPRVMEADVRYRNLHDDVRRTADPLDVPLEVAPERDEFDVEAIDATYEPGERDEIELVVTNRKSETLTDVEAKVFTNDPLDNHDDDGFVPSLEPGESANLTFEISVDDGATPQTYPLRMDFRYDDERSNSQLTDTYRIPIEVQEPDDGLVSLGAVVVILAAVGAIAVVVRRFGDGIEAALEGVPVLERLTDLSVPERLAGLSVPESVARLVDRSGGDNDAIGSGTATPSDGSVWPDERGDDGDADAASEGADGPETAALPDETDVEPDAIDDRDVFSFDEDADSHAEDDRTRPDSEN